jgi:glycosyltransferase involved in cell wall biosynthesis
MARATPGDRPPTIAFITTCKGRLHHLRQTLPTMAAQRPEELIVVDYDCQDGTGAWVEANFPQAKVVRASQPDGGFNVGRARNLGAAAASSEWLFFVDADIGLAPNLTSAMRREIEPGRFYRPLLKRGAVTGQAYGTFCCRAEDFAAVEGFDEVIEGWGYEDRDLYERFGLLGLKQWLYSPELLRIIAHEDDQRHLKRGMRARDENEAVNACYARAKREVSRLRGGTGNLPLAERLRLMDSVRRVVGQWHAAGAKEPLPVRVPVTTTKPLWLASRMRMAADTAVVVVLDPPSAKPARAAAAARRKAKA